MHLKKSNEFMFKEFVFWWKFHWGFSQYVSMDSGDGKLLNRWPCSLTHICVTSLHCVNQGVQNWIISNNIYMSHYGYSQCNIWNTSFKIHIIMKNQQKCSRIFNQHDLSNTNCMGSLINNSTYINSSENTFWFCCLLWHSWTNQKQTINALRTGFIKAR